MKHVIYSTTILLTLLCSTQFAQAQSSNSNVTQDNLFSIVDEQPNFGGFGSEQELYEFINSHYAYFEPVAKGCNEHDALLAAIEHLEIVYQLCAKLRAEDPNRQWYQEISGIVSWAYLWSLNQFYQFADHSKINSANFEGYHKKMQKIFLEVIDNAIASNKEEFQYNNYYQYETLLLAVNTLSYEIVKNELKSTPKLIAKMVHAFDLIIDRISTTDELYALHTYICMLKLNGDIDKACKYIEKGLSIDKHHQDFVTLSYSEEYCNFKRQQDERNLAALAERVKELRTKYLGKQAALTNSIHNPRSSQRASAPKSSNGRWVAMSDKMYKKTYGTSFFDQIGISTKQIEELSSGYFKLSNETAIMVYQGDLVVDGRDDIFSTDNDRAANPEKINLKQQDIHPISIQGNLVINGSLADELYMLYVKGNLYANQFTVEHYCPTKINGCTYIDELFRYSTLANFHTQKVECALKSQADDESGLAGFPLIEYYGSELPEDNDYSDSNNRRKLAFELLRAGILSPNAALELGVRYHDAYIKYLEPENYYSY